MIYISHIRSWHWDNEHLNYYKAYQASLRQYTCLSQMHKSKNKSTFFLKNTGLIRLHHAFTLSLSECILQIQALAIDYKPSDFIENLLIFQIWVSLTHMK
ncbi:MAG TPA: hypothetical protein PKD32_09765 [Saprospiraceae bacterium]|nr:hypothetical protein [Saprospiraceae bacterium]